MVDMMHADWMEHWHVNVCVGCVCLPWDVCMCACEYVGIVRVCDGKCVGVKMHWPADQNSRKGGDGWYAFCESGLCVRVSLVNRNQYEHTQKVSYVYVFTLGRHERQRKLDAFV